MPDVPEEDIEAAEDRPGTTGHDHVGVTAEDGTLAAHLRAVHGLEIAPSMSPATVEGLHDRLHASSKAADD